MTFSAPKWLPCYCKIPNATDTSNVSYYGLNWIWNKALSFIFSSSHNRQGIFKFSIRLKNQFLIVCISINIIYSQWNRKTLQSPGKRIKYFFVFSCSPFMTWDSIHAPRGSQGSLPFKKNSNFSMALQKTSWSIWCNRHIKCVLLWLETEYETKHPSGYQYQLLSDCNCGGTQSQLNRVINFTLISSWYGQALYCGFLVDVLYLWKGTTWQQAGHGLCLGDA